MDIPYAIREMGRVVFLAQRAYRQMIYEISHSGGKETGGILLGQTYQKNLIIREAVDGGINIKSNEYSFLYDKQYVEHVAERIMTLYTPPLQVVGVWHKHNSYHEFPFSDADIEIHKQMYELSQGESLSCLFQKLDDSSFEMDVYRLLPDGKYEEINVFMLGDDDHLNEL